MADDTFRYLRPDLAEQICNALSGAIPASAELFLAAARRTGKTYFLLNDLGPEAQSRSWSFVYVDLWRSASNGTLIAIKQAIQNTLRKNESTARRFVNEQVSKISLGKILTFDLRSHDRAPSMTDMLSALQQVTGERILLVLDEAQQSLIDPDGETAMAELKAAREELNRAGAEKNLLILFTGSHRDKLSRLVSGQKMPFYGQAVGAFPTLDSEFSAALAAYVNDRLGRVYTPETVEHAMAIVGRQPIAVWRAIERISWPQIGQASDRREHESPDAALIRVATEIRDSAFRDLVARYQDLSPLARALFDRIIAADGNIAPFHEQTRQSLAAEIGRENAVPNTQIQTAINTLRDNDLIWSPKRGVYLIEDESRVRAWATQRETDSGDP